MAAGCVCILALTSCSKGTDTSVTLVETEQEMTTTEKETTTQETTTQKETATQKPAKNETETKNTTRKNATTEEEEESTQETTTKETESEEDETTQESTTEETEAQTTTQEITTEETESEDDAAAQESTTAETEAETTTQEVTTTEAETETTTQEVVKKPVENTAELSAAALQALPGIVCWGDSLTYGYGGNGESYPATLQRLINERLVSGIPVVNNGVCVEQTYTIMARAGVWPMLANKFTIPADCTPVEIHVELQNGMYTNLTAFGDAGLNPVTIAGIKGILTDDYHSDAYGYCYFTRLEPGEELEVEGGTVIHSAGADMYGGYINVIFMGENGVYENAEDLISQYQLFIDTRGLSRYIIIGLTTGDNSSRSDMSQKMAAYFGSKYIDMRTELVNRGPELVGLERQSGDWYNVQEGLVMGYLMSDNIHLNEYGYRAAGMILYERMDALGYFDGVKSVLAQYGN